MTMIEAQAPMLLSLFCITLSESRRRSTRTKLTAPLLKLSFYRTYQKLQVQILPLQFAPYSFVARRARLAPDEEGKENEEPLPKSEDELVRGMQCYHPEIM